MNRRAYLTTVGASLSLLAGCTASASNESSTSSEYPSKPVQAEGEGITVRQSISRDSLKYLEETDKVQYIAAYQHKNHEAVENGSKPECEPVYKVIPFERWGETESASVGAQAAQNALSAKLGSEGKGVSVGVSTEDEQPLILVSHVNEPTVSFDNLVEITPQLVTSTVSLSGHEYTATHPVKVTHRDSHYLIV